MRSCVSQQGGEAPCLSPLLLFHALGTCAAPSVDQPSQRRRQGGMSEFIADASKSASRVGVYRDAPTAFSPRGSRSGMSATTYAITAIVATQSAISCGSSLSIVSESEWWCQK